MDNFMIIAIIIGIVAVIYFVQKAAGRAETAIERTIRSSAASSEEDLLHTVVSFKTNAPLSEIRQAIANNVIIKSDIWNGKVTTLADSDNGIAWEFGVISLGNGFKAQIAYSVTDGITLGVFSVTSHAMKAAVSPFIKKMTELRNQIITAFKSVDPNVEITTSQQQMTQTRR